MNRRNFIRNLGLAVAGATIASKIELIERVIPIQTAEGALTWNSATPIDFRTLSAAYNRACVGSCEPDIILIHKDVYTYIQEKCLEPQYCFTDESVDFDNIIFRGAKITYGDLDRNKDPILKDLVFIQDKHIPMLFGVRKQHIITTPHYQNFYNYFPKL